MKKRELLQYCSTAAIAVAMSGCGGGGGSATTQPSPFDGMVAVITQTVTTVGNATTQMSTSGGGTNSLIGGGDSPTSPVGKAASTFDSLTAAIQLAQDVQNSNWVAVASDATKLQPVRDSIPAPFGAMVDSAMPVVASMMKANADGTKPDAATLPADIDPQALAATVGNPPDADAGSSNPGGNPMQLANALFKAVGGPSQQTPAANPTGDGSSADNAIASQFDSSACASRRRSECPQFPGGQRDADDGETGLPEPQGQSPGTAGPPSTGDVVHICPKMPAALKTKVSAMKAKYPAPVNRNAKSKTPAPPKTPPGTPPKDAKAKPA